VGQEVAGWDEDVLGAVSSAWPHSAEEGLLIGPIPIVEWPDWGFSENEIGRMVYNVRKCATIKKMKL
jgi:hypothetical protein